MIYDGSAGLFDVGFGGIERHGGCSLCSGGILAGVGYLGVGVWCSGADWWLMPS